MPDTDMCPNDLRAWMAPEEFLQLDDRKRLLTSSRKRCVDVVVNDHDQADFPRELEDPVEGRIEERRNLAGDF
jgi:hypothetical protein